MSWPEDLYRGIPIQRAETWPEYLRRREDERRWAPAKVDGRRMAETGTGSGRSPTSAVVADDLPNTQDLSTPLPSGSIER